MMGNWDDLWGEWQIVGNSKGYSSPRITNTRCRVKVGDELRESDYRGARWNDLVSVDGGRLRSDFVVEDGVYGVGLEGQLVFHNSRIGRRWQDLGSPVGEIMGTPAVAQDPRSGSFVVVRGGDNRLYLRVSRDGGRSWGDWEQSDTLRAGQFTGDPSTFTIQHWVTDDKGTPDLTDDTVFEAPGELVLTGRSLENEMASISRVIGGSSTDAPPDSLWGDWSVVGNSRGYSSSIFVKEPMTRRWQEIVHCFVKVGDEVRHARYREGGWDNFASLDGGRFRSDPIVIVGRNRRTVEVYGVGMDGQMAHNVWSSHDGAWQGWENLGRPEPGISGTPAVETFGLDRFIVAKGSDNRLYLRWLESGTARDPWEQGEKLRPGLIRGNVLAAVKGFRPPTLVVIGRSLEDEMASISLSLPERG